eukprot:gene28673-37657_t
MFKVKVYHSGKPNSVSMLIDFLYKVMKAISLKVKKLFQHVSNGNCQIFFCADYGNLS